MNERVCVHGAAGSIGSSCVEITSGKHHIILDYGKPLEGEGKVPFKFPKSENARKNYIAVISHSHGDHAGFINEIPQDVPVYMHWLTKRALELQGVLNRQVTTLNAFEIIEFGIVNFTLVPVKHSAADACGILIGTENQTIFYTGDFRSSGFASDLQAYISKTSQFSDNKLTLITEATHIGTENKKGEENSIACEDDMPDALAQEFGKPGFIMVKVANQNVARIQSLYRAAVKSGRLLVTEPYTAMCCKRLSCSAETYPYSERTGTVRPYNVKPDGKVWKVYCYPTKRTTEMGKDGSLYGLKEFKISTEELKKNADNIVFVANTETERYFEKNKMVDRVVWSMWTGYPEYEKLCAKHRVKVIHSSGHVSPENLVSFVRKIRPDRTIVVHTENQEEAEKLLAPYTEIIHVQQKKEIIL